ncbi:adenylate/guanylate cyclase domain-containing protein [Antrihabitans cavernicola]|uniref:Adenylate/guanylate cyclase domain-containing protein n=1 Tax=Antrihabitans cavernicola TaxID=2495913 RepID=A0A5A7S4C8_9NOCA|nr:adenylate/guanylate cyclase domain-containing protein [Spelaeibacter cavernicola]KAA0019433.1 adenylate/guanylate cyclase domain-containing protein [Spelaeibacter cavernicola]
MDTTRSDSDDSPERPDSPTTPPPQWWSIAAQEVEPYLLGQIQYDRDEVVEIVGLPLEQVRRLWISLGFPVNPDPTAKMFSDADIRALNLVKGLVEDGLIDSESQVAVARTVGQTMARLAEWQVDVISKSIIDGIVSAKRPVSTAEDIRELTESVSRRTVPVLEELQNYVWRRHLAASASRTFAGKEPNPDRRTLIVGFADMVGYTSLTRSLDATELTDLLEAFESNATDIISRHGGWVVKNVGDEVMFAVEDPGAAAEIALELQESTAAAELTPQLRIGMATGPVLQRFGDLYGSVVNIAARLTGIAAPGTILLDSRLAEILEPSSAYRFKHLRAVRVRGFNKIRAHVLRRAKQPKVGSSDESA